MKKTQLFVYVLAGSATLASWGVALRSQAQTTTGTTIAYTTEARATVEAVDQASRELRLRGAGGAPLTVKAGPEVRNLQQIRVGDQVVIRYVEALAARLLPPGESGSEPSAQAGVARSTPGMPPTAVVGDQIRASVQVDAVDRASNTLTFTGPSGAVRTVTVRDADAQRFLHTLKPGDRVGLVYTESLAVAVEPMSR